MCELAKLWMQVAPSLTPLVGLGAVGFAWLQLRANRTNQRETMAKATFREFLKLACEHPDLAEGDYQSLIKEGKKLKYEWFVGYFLWAVEEISEYAKKDATWQRNLQLLANKHRDYFANNEEFRETEIKAYAPSVQAIVERTIQRTAAQ